VAKEREKGYQQYVKEVLSRFTDAKDELDPIRKKEVVRVIFKEILIKDRRIVSFELFEPFKSFLEGKEPCQNKLLEELIPGESLGCVSSPSAGRWAWIRMTVIPKIIMMYAIENKAVNDDKHELESPA
jgi:hypothetical protein